MHNIFVLLATGCYAGTAKNAPGTVGTLVAVILMLLTFSFGITAKFFIFIVLFVAGIIVSEYYEKFFDEEDPSEVVIDEYASYYMVLMFVSFTFINVLLTFFLFRFFDIVKPYPIKKLEDIGGGTGIMLDDLVAALYSLGIFYLIRIFI